VVVCRCRKLIEGLAIRDEKPSGTRRIITHSEADIDGDSGNHKPVATCFQIFGMSRGGIGDEEVNRPLD
jgi:hypothetical protein